MRLPAWGEGCPPARGTAPSRGACARDDRKVLHSRFRERARARGGPGERRSWMRLGLVQPLFSGLEPFEPVSSTARASASSSVK